MMCAVDGCEVGVAITRLMCPRHWRQLPPDLQRSVNAAYRLYRRSLRGTAEEYQRCSRELDEVQHAAVNALKAGG